MSTQRTRCWSCGESFFKSERHCPNCQADSWNPPQGPAAARSRPIMGPQTYRPANLTPASAALGGILATSPAYISAPTYDGRQTTIAAGVGILATLAAMSFWFWFAIGFIGAINEPDFGGSYLSTVRVLIAFVVAVIGTVGTWMIARQAVEA